MFSSSVKQKLDEFPEESGLTQSEIQKERAEYVHNIGIEYRYGCFEEKRPDSCHLLGEYFEAVDKNFEAAFHMFRENCERRGWPRSCYKFGSYLLAGKECEPSLKKAMPPMETACNADMAKGCMRLAQIHWTAEHDREPDSAKAEQLMRKACDLENWEACWILSTWYMGPIAKFAKQQGRATPLDMRTGALERNMDKALEYGIRACEQGSIPQSCMNVSRMYRIGDGVPKDPDKAKHYHNRMRELHSMMKRGWETGLTG